MSGLHKPFFNLPHKAECIFPKLKRSHTTQVDSKQMDKVYLVSWARKLLGNRTRWNLKGALKLAITATYKQPDFRHTKGLCHFPKATET